MDFSEVLLIAVLGLILFGPEELPTIAKTIGRVTYQVKQAFSDVLSDVSTSILDEPEKVSRSASTPFPQEMGGEKKGPGT